MKRILRITWFFAVLCACRQGLEPLPENMDFREEMRALVRAIRSEADMTSPDFLVIPQNGQALATADGEPGSALQTEYIAAINGTGREDLFYGYTADDVPTPPDDRDEMLALCDLFEQNGVQVLVIDYCTLRNQVDNSYAQNQAKGYISFAAPDRDLRVIPNYPAVPFQRSIEDIDSLARAGNFLYLINPDNFSSKEAFLTALSGTDYDLLVIDLFFDGSALSAADVTRLKTKKSGGARLVTAYMSIGEAEDYRYYWQAGWRTGSPAWLDAENPDWQGNYKVRYWMQDWQNLIYVAADSYLKRILNAGFDGVYLDLIDAYEYFEEQ